MNKETSLFEELKRRNVVRVGVVYLIVAWLLAQVSDLMLENFEAPGWVIKVILLSDSGFFSGVNGTSLYCAQR